MIVKRLYYAGQDLSLQPGERAIIWQTVHLLSLEDDSPYPHRRLQIRDSLDGTIRIFEMVCDTDQLQISTFRQRLADAFSLTPGQIAVNATQQVFDVLPTNIVTFRYPGATNWFRLALFGGVNATALESAQEARAYIRANLAAWETEEG